LQAGSGQQRRCCKSNLFTGGPEPPPAGQAQQPLTPIARSTASPMSSA
jgi:hypothetical protein